MGIYKDKKSPYWLYDFTVKGTRFRGSTEAVKKTEAQAVYDGLRRKILLGETQKEQMTLSQAFARYWLDYGKFQKSSISTKSHIRHILKYFGERLYLHEIGQNELEKYISYCRTEKYKKVIWSHRLQEMVETESEKKTSAASVNRRISAFQSMHRRARDSWKVDTQAIDFKGLKLAEPEPQNNTLTNDEAQALLDAAPKHMKDFLMLALFTGFRKANILELKGSQIDMQKRLITVYGKSRKEKGKLIAVPMVDELFRYIIAGKLHERENVITYKGQPVRDIKTSFNRLCTKTIGRKIRIHDLRHTFGTWLYERTGDLKLVKDVLHHADIRTSLRYTHTTKDSQRERMNAALSPELRQTKLAKENSK